MLLVLDVGNTSTVIGLFEGEELVHHWRVMTRRGQTADEYFLLVKELLGLAGLEADEIEGISVSCVVPTLAPPLMELGRNYFGLQPLMVGPGVKTGMPIHVDNPREVGADRIVNAVAAYEEVRSSVIVVDFGTASTFDFVSSRGTFEGGAIAPGVYISTEALFRAASKLPRVEMIRPPRVIGKNTVAAMQSGIVIGYVGMVDAMVDRMKKEIKEERPGEPEPVVIGSGGLAALFADQARSIQRFDQHLTLQGLRIIYNRNRD